MSDPIDGFCGDGWLWPGDTPEYPGSPSLVSAFFCQPISRHLNPLGPSAASAYQTPLVKPASRLIFTPWIFRKADQTAMHA
jgi:hypothetical protein